jgi:nucleotide-binding universal stress UspA family protein
MSGTRRRPATIAATLAGTTRDVRRAVHATDPARPPGLVPLRDAGWQLTQLTGELADLVALLAEHTGHHIEHAKHVRQVSGEPAAEQLARACRDLAALRRALDTAHTAARDYYTTISHLSHT